MSDVVTRAQEQARPEEEVLADLETTRLSQVLRGDTWRSHERAEYSPFEQALVKGTLRQDVYAAQLAQLYHAYVVLEETAEQLQDHPVVGALYTPEVHRREAVETDLAYYYGPDWRDHVEPLPTTTEYVEHIQRIAREWPIGFIAHHYTRYLADLSGGFMIDKAIKEAYGLDEDGRRVYIWEGIPDGVEWKNAYRGTLDQMDVSPEDKRRLITEVLVAYEYNIDLIEQLTKLHDPITDAA